MFAPNKMQNESLYIQDKISFFELIEYLLPPSTNLEGCEIKIPESVFFDGGKPVFIAMTGPDKKMKS